MSLKLYSASLLLDISQRNQSSVFKRLIQILLHLAFLVLRPLTVGVRGICFDVSLNSFLLVKHTYSNDWALPGGGVEVGESIEEALNRELKEEVGIRCKNIDVMNVYHNVLITKRDHVVICLVSSWEEDMSYEQPRLEISKKKWFTINDLPKNLTPCTRYALKEYVAKSGLQINNQNTI